MFRRQTKPCPVEVGPDPDSDGAAVIPGELGRIAERYGLRPWSSTATPTAVSPLAAAIQRADVLWAAPRAGQVQTGTDLLCGGRAPESLIGVEAWPVVLQSGGGPALVLVDLNRRVRVVVDVGPMAVHGSAQPGWVPAATVARCARMPGSFQLWQHWRPELSAHTPHDWSAACEDHTHLDRPNAQGQLTTAIPQHDAWTMSRSWLPTELVLPAASDARWVALNASDRPLRQRNRLIRSTWDVVSYEEFAAGLAAHRAADPPLDPAIATVLRMMLPVAPAGPTG